MRSVPVVAAILFAFLAIAPPASAGNFGVHAGLADDTWRDPYFRAGALLADVDHWLPPGEPQTDNAAFAIALAQRAWTGSRNAWRFATGWYEHLDQDTRFSESRARVVAAYPLYTDVDLRLGFDYWTLRKHPFPTDYDWILNEVELLTLVQGGLAATDLGGVRQAVDELLHSTNTSNPGLALQLNAALAYGTFYPTRVADMAAEYDRYYALVTVGYYPVLPRLDLELRTIGALVNRHAAAPGAVLPHLKAAMALEATRPPNWMGDEAAALASFVDALPSAGLPMGIRFIVTERAWRIMDLLG